MSDHSVHMHITCSCGSVVVSCSCKIVPAGTTLRTKVVENGCEPCQDRKSKIIRQSFVRANYPENGGIEGGSV